MKSGIGSHPEFRFNAGRLSLDLAATVRRRGSVPNDVLHGVGAVGRWLVAAGLLESEPALTGAQAKQFIALREAIWTVTDSAIKGETLPAEATQAINTAARKPLAVPQLDAQSCCVTVATAAPVDTALATIARDAIDLIGGPLRVRIKACEQADCQMLFVDTSPSKRRRWCSMDRCGSRAKLTTFRRKRGDENTA